MTVRQTYLFILITSLLLLFIVCSFLYRHFENKTSKNKSNGQEKLTKAITNFPNAHSFKVQMPKDSEYPNGFDVKFYLKQNNKNIELPFIYGRLHPFPKEVSFIFSYQENHRLKFKFDGSSKEYDLNSYVSPPKKISTIHPVFSDRKYIKPKEFFIKYVENYGNEQNSLKKNVIELYFDFVPKK